LSHKTEGVKNVLTIWYLTLTLK